jgi:hypothetical protein
MPIFTPKPGGKASAGGLYVRPAINSGRPRSWRGFNPFKRERLEDMIKHIQITDEPFLPPRERKPR